MYTCVDCDTTIPDDSNNSHKLSPPKHYIDHTYIQGPIILSKSKAYFHIKGKPRTLTLLDEVVDGYYCCDCFLTISHIDNHDHRVVINCDICSEKYIPYQEALITEDMADNCSTKIINNNIHCGYGSIYDDCVFSIQDNTHLENSSPGASINNVCDKCITKLQDNKVITKIY